MVYLIKKENDADTYGVTCLVNGFNLDLKSFLENLEESEFKKDEVVGIMFGNNEQKALLSFYLYYINKKSEIDKCLDEFNKSLIVDENEIIKSSVEKFTNINKNGKNIRGVLISLGCEVAGKINVDATPLSVAYETFQTSILVHDDIIDKSTIRRGVETLGETYKKEFNRFDNEASSVSNSLALCLGDLGFYFANNLIVNSYKTHENLAMLLEYYNKVVINTIKGEVLDVYLPYKEKISLVNSTNEEDVFDIYKLKTSWYTTIGPFTLGLILGGEKNTQKYEEFLEMIGIAFQIKDDIIGIFSEESVIGKSVISDISEYKQTILYSYVMNTSYKDKLIKCYKSKLNKKTIEKIKNIYVESGALVYAENKMKELFASAREMVSKFRISTEYKNILRGLILYLEIRDK